MARKKAAPPVEAEVEVPVEEAPVEVPVVADKPRPDPHLPLTESVAWTVQDI